MKTIGKVMMGGVAAAILFGAAWVPQADARSVVLVKRGPVVKKTVVVKPAKRVTVKKTVVVKPAVGIKVKTTTVVARPAWAIGAKAITFASTPYYYHTGFDVHFGGIALNFTLTNTAPQGYIYYHPYSGKRFKTVAGFRAYCNRHPRQPRTLTLIAV